MNKQLSEWINGSKNIVFFGGAGTSTESDIPDFRSQTGLYSSPYGNYSSEAVLSRSFFFKHPDVFYRFFREKIYFPNAKPNKAHLALAALEARGNLSAIITQNIDGLHQLGGSRNVLELHGSIHRNFCMACGKTFTLSHMVDEGMPIPVCDECGGIVRPNVVLYEEALDMDVFQEAAEHIRKADMMIVGGTSLLVYPAAGLVRDFEGDKLVLINKQATPCDGIADLVIHESIGETLGRAVLGGQSNEIA